MNELEVIVMRTDFQFVALPIERFTHLFSMNDAEIVFHGGRRMTVDAHPGFPCRVSLMDAPIGERVIHALSTSRSKFSLSSDWTDFRS